MSVEWWVMRGCLVSVIVGAFLEQRSGDLLGTIYTTGLCLVVAVLLLCQTIEECTRGRT